MKKTWIRAGLFMTGVLLSCSPAVPGQQKEPAPAGGVTITTASPQGERVPPGAATFSFVNSEFAYSGTPVKGAPYSSWATTRESLRSPSGVSRSSTHDHLPAVAWTSDGAACNPATNHSRDSDRAPDRYGQLYLSTRCPRPRCCGRQRELCL